MTSLSHLNKYLLKYKWTLLLGMLFIIISNVFAVYSPQVVRHAFDLIGESYALFQSYPGEETHQLGVPAWILKVSDALGINLDAQVNSKADLQSTIVTLSIFLAGLYLALFLFKGIFLFLTRQTIIVMSRWIEFDLKNEIYQHYQELSMAFYKRNNTGDLMNRISEDVSKVRMYLGPAIMYTINLVVLFILAITVMVNVNAELTLYVLAPLPIMSITIYYVSTIINRKSERVQRQQSKLSTFVQEAFSGIRVVKAFHREGQFQDAFEKECEHYRSKTLDLVKVDAVFMPSILLLIGLSTILTICIGGLKAISGEITIGNIAEFVIYVNMLTWPFAAVGWVTSLVQRASASQKRINEFLHTSPEIANPPNGKQSIQGKLTFKNVSFTYPDSGINALKNISFSVDVGETLAIVGRTGSGKSTIANLIVRQYDASSGQVEVDDIDIKLLDLRALRSSIGYVPQDTFLFSDTLFNNISFGIAQDKPTKDKVETAAKDAGIYENIMSFSQQFETILGERGITLSGGQKQRVSIARAIIRNPQVLIFDDSLSAVDTQTEEEILNNLRRIMKGKTTVLISHRVSTVKHANQIIVLEEGRVVESGSHEELIEKGEVYYNLYQKQLLEDEQIMD